MELLDLLNQGIGMKTSSGLLIPNYYLSLHTLTYASVQVDLFVPSQEHKDILDGYALVIGMPRLSVEVDPSVDYMYRLI